LNLATNLEWSAFFFPDQPVISEGDSVTSYARLNRQANRVATALLELNIQPGDHIGIFAPNSGDWIAFYFGVLKTGAVPVVTYNHYYRHVIGSVGTAAPGVEIQIRDQDGHLLEQGQEGGPGFEFTPASGSASSP